MARWVLQAPDAEPFRCLVTGCNIAVLSGLRMCSCKIVLIFIAIDDYVERKLVRFWCSAHVSVR